MAFNTAPGRAEYTAIAAQTVFSFVFKIYTDEDVKVYSTLSGATPDDVVDLLTLGTDYTVSINGDNGGDVTLLTGASVNTLVTVVRALDIDRQTEYQNRGDLLSDTLNMDQNYQTYLIADSDTDGSRHLEIQSSLQSVGSTISTVIPIPSPLELMRWDSTATALEGITGESLVASEIDAIGLVAVDKISDLATANPLTDKSILVRGYYEANDGGGGIFNYDATQSAVNNGGTIINGWIRQYVNEISVLWFGAKGDGITDQTAIFTAVAAVTNIAIAPKAASSYLISSSLVNAGTTFIFYGESTQVTGTVTAQQLKALFTDNGYISGIPIADDIRDKKIGIISGTVQQNATTRSQWDWIKDTEHEPLGVDDSTPAIATGTGLVIPFDQTYTKALTMTVCPDETLASNLGMTIGPSIGLSSMLLQASINLTLSAHIKWNGSAWVKVYGESQGAGNHEAEITNMVGSGSSLTITHTWIPGTALALTPHSDGGAVAPNMPTIQTQSDLQVVVNFVNAGGTLAAVNDTKSSFQFVKNFRGKVYLDGGSAGGSPSGDVLDLDRGNIWFHGIMQF